MNEAGEFDQFCTSCKCITRWQVSTAMVNTAFVHADFVGDYEGIDLDQAKHGQTITMDGPPKKIMVHKCSECGRSIRRM
jgi:hypothetical protein